MPEQLVKVYTNRTTEGWISMWGTLHLNTNGGKIAGWLCDSWTEAGAPANEALRPHLYWLSKEDDRFHIAMIDIPIVGMASIKLGLVDEQIEPRREVFMRTKLAQWEAEYLSKEGVELS